MSGLLLVFVLLTVVAILQMRSVFEDQQDRANAAVESARSLAGARLQLALLRGRAAVTSDAERELQLAEERLLQCRTTAAEALRAQDEAERRYQALEAAQGTCARVVQENAQIEEINSAIRLLVRQFGGTEEGMRPGVFPIPSDLLFETNEYELSDEGREYLRRVTPGLADGLLGNEARGTLVHRVIIEGHSSRSGRDRRNMELSARRAIAVYSFLAFEMEDFPHREAFIRLLAPTGRGEIDAQNPDPDSNDERDRRVDLRIEFATLSATGLPELGQATDPNGQKRGRPIRRGEGSR